LGGLIAPNEPEFSAPNEPKIATTKRSQRQSGRFQGRRIALRRTNRNRDDETKPMVVWVRSFRSDQARGFPDREDEFARLEAPQDRKMRFPETKPISSFEFHKLDGEIEFRPNFMAYAGSIR
jgi:hypothetical protein